jgi:hypothetical protein
MLAGSIWSLSRPRFRGKVEQVKPLVIAISGLAFALICVAGASLWQGRIQTHYDGGTLLIVGRWSDSVRICHTIDPGYGTTREDQRSINCTVQNEPVWYRG